MLGANIEFIEMTQGRKSRDISNLDFEMRYFNEKLVFNRYFKF